MRDLYYVTHIKKVCLEDYKLSEKESVDTTFSIIENSEVNDIVGTVSAEDPDGDYIYFEIIDGNINGTFSITEQSGLIRVANPDSLDYENENLRQFILTVVAKEAFGPHADTGTVTIEVTNDTSDDDTFLASRASSNNIKIYPNPSKDLLTIQTGISGTYTVEITSLNGQKLYSRIFSANTCKVDLSSFQKGVYFITIRSKDFVTTEKIIKL